jgi:hypothetical protein
MGRIILKQRINFMKNNLLKTLLVGASFAFVCGDALGSSTVTPLSSPSKRSSAFSSPVRDVPKNPSQADCDQAIGALVSSPYNMKKDDIDDTVKEYYQNVHELNQKIWDIDSLNGLVESELAVEKAMRREKQRLFRILINKHNYDAKNPGTKRNLGEEFKRASSPDSVSTLDLDEPVYDYPKGGRFDGPSQNVKEAARVRDEQRRLEAMRQEEERVRAESRQAFKSKYNHLELNQIISESDKIIDGLLDQGFDVRDLSALKVKVRKLNVFPAIKVALATKYTNTIEYLKGERNQWSNEAVKSIIATEPYLDAYAFIILECPPAVHKNIVGKYRNNPIHPAVLETARERFSALHPNEQNPY